MRRILFVIPLAFLGLFYFYPLVAILLLVGREARDGPWAAIREVAEDSYYRYVLWFSVWQGAVSTALTLGAGLPMAFLFARYHFKFKRAWRALAALPFVMPTLVVASGFSALLGPRGLLNDVYQLVTGRDIAPIQVEHTLGLLLLAHVFYNVSLVLRIVGGFWANLDDRLNQVATVLGASRGRAFLEVTLPLLMPAISSASLLIFVVCFGAFGTILVLAGPRYATLEVEIYNQVSAFGDFPVAAVLAMVQLVVTLALTTVYARMQARTTIALQLQSQNSQLQSLAGTARLLQVGVFGFILLVLVAPLVALVARSLGSQNGIGLQAYLAMLTLDASGALFSVAPILAVRNSLLVAAGTATLALALGVPAAYLIEQRRTGNGLGATALETLFMMPMGTSALTLGLGYIVAFAAPPVAWRASPWLMPVAHTLVALPFVVRALLPVLRSIDDRLREAARVLGASSIQVWWEVDAPILMRGMVVAGTLAFATSIGEFGASLLIARPEFPTMPLVIYAYLGQAGAKNYGIALAMSCILMVVVTVSYMLIERIRVDRSEF